MKWYRVVLDEAQFIRNRCVIQLYVSGDQTHLVLCFRATRASKVVAQLRTKFRWMLTGTPVTNTLYEFILCVRKNYAEIIRR
jgi:SNF2 family DNA or RNA helicase